jgi:hypothetical protein
VIRHAGVQQREERLLWTECRVGERVSTSRGKSKGAGNCSLHAHPTQKTSCSDVCCSLCTQDCVLWCGPPYATIVLCSGFPLYSLGISYFLPSVSFSPVLVLPLMRNYAPHSSANPSLPPGTCRLQRKRCSACVLCLTQRRHRRICKLFFFFLPFYHMWKWNGHSLPSQTINTCSLFDRWRWERTVYGLILFAHLIP